ncbi:hypothetical protein [Azospirillum argentinense]
MPLRNPEHQAYAASTVQRNDVAHGSIGVRRASGRCQARFQEATGAQAVGVRRVCRTTARLGCESGIRPSTRPGGGRPVIGCEAQPWPTGVLLRLQPGHRVRARLTPTGRPQSRNAPAT